MDIECGQSIDPKQVDANSEARNNIVQFPLKDLQEHEKEIILFAFCPLTVDERRPLMIGLRPTTGIDLSHAKQLADENKIEQLEEYLVSLPIYHCSKFRTAACPISK